MSKILGVEDRGWYLYLHAYIKIIPTLTYMFTCKIDIQSSKPPPPKHLPCLSSFGGGVLVYPSHITIVLWLISGVFLLCHADCRDGLSCVCWKKPFVSSVVKAEPIGTASCGPYAMTMVWESSAHPQVSFSALGMVMDPNGAEGIRFPTLDLPHPVHPYFLAVPT